MEHWIETLWNPYLLLCFFGVGLYISLMAGFFQGNILFWWRETLGKGNFSQLSALFTALATTIGTGSIAGVATAIWFGGAGSIFWMWVSAFFGMMLSACEKILTIQYRVIHPNAISKKEATFVGGPMYYLAHGLHCPFLAGFFSIACILSTFVGGGLVQSASISQGMEHLFGIPPLVTGSGLMLLVFCTLKGGMERVAQISTVLVPIMATLYLGSGIICIFQDIPVLIQVLEHIFASAFTTEAMVGGGSGYSVSTAIRYGMARGIFTNEAGLGASAMAHGNAKVDHPARQGMWGILEVFFATMVVCTITALVILTSGVYQQEEALYYITTGQTPPIPIGVPLTQTAFSVTLGQWGSVIVLFSLILFAFTSILGWACYGNIALEYLSNSPRAKTFYTFCLLSCLWWGSMGNTQTLWLWVDGSIALMAIPNLIGLVLLAPKAMELLEDFKRNHRTQAISKGQKPVLHKKTFF